MKEVVNEIFYHCNSTSNQNPYNLLSEGDILNIGKTINPFMSSYENQVPNVINNKQALISAVTFYWHYARETIFEEERKNINENLPSRFTSLWVGDYESMKDWKMHFEHNKVQLLELSLTGVVFKCDATFVEGNPIPLSKVRENANKYWGGHVLDNKKVEYLFTGKAKVIKVL
ncbi:DUF2441 domain-containing protein [Virgibacillus oceani]